MASPVDDAYNSEYSRPSETDKLRMPFFRGRYRLTGKTYLGGSAIVKIATDEKTSATVANPNPNPNPNPNSNPNPHPVDEKTSATVATQPHAKTRTFVKELKFLRQLRSEYVVPLETAFLTPTLTLTLTLTLILTLTRWRALSGTTRPCGASTCATSW